MHQGQGAKDAESHHRSRRKSHAHIPFEVDGKVRRLNVPWFKIIFLWYSFQSIILPHVHVSPEIGITKSSTKCFEGWESDYHTMARCFLVFGGARIRLFYPPSFLWKPYIQKYWIWKITKLEEFLIIMRIIHFYPKFLLNKMSIVSEQTSFEFSAFHHISKTMIIDFYPSSDALSSFLITFWFYYCYITILVWCLYFRFLHEDFSTLLTRIFLWNDQFFCHILNVSIDFSFSFFYHFIFNYRT